METADGSLKALQRILQRHRNTNKFVNKSNFDLQITVTFSFDNITLTENLKGYSTDSKIMIIEIVI